ncbi:hypothetical protein ASPNIDRAFT_182654 [Aspergillus niger ATCC 1015]|uniref:CWF21 domain-containing protein n=1 Tax=Aspergillus niger (strain ATCC 1015 / CBS 113.46 / FGSC A1144 / LSHB Ac4 / NCTC 3858a / NRRL 328 / USDA 3528.7) TaxID=380704 RepID=G3XXL5_ASPNA|nr:hypothetical protein ASPNIDRAFT_182654 [Aspergillus niger ATCC 1015]
MSSNVGLSTPRGSGTSGYVQRNFAFMKPRNAGYGAPYPPISGSNSADPSDKPFKQRQPDKQILEHDRRRAIEVKVMEERERLEEENERIEEELESKQKKKQKKGGDDDDDRRQFKSYQVHELAEAKIEESERLRRALGIKEEK